MDNFQIIATVMSGLWSILLSIIAFFSVKTLERVSKIDLKVTELYIKHDNTEERSRDNKREIDRHWGELEKARFRIHSIEGEQKTVAQLLKDNRLI